MEKIQTKVTIKEQSRIVIFEQGFVIFFQTCIFHMLPFLLTSMQKSILEQIEFKFFLVWTSAILSISGICVAILKLFWIVKIDHKMRVYFAIGFLNIGIVLLSLVVRFKSLSLFILSAFILNFGSQLGYNAIICIGKTFIPDVSKGVGLGVGLGAAFASLMVVIADTVGITYNQILYGIFLVNLSLIYFIKWTYKLIEEKHIFCINNQIEEQKNESIEELIEKDQMQNKLEFKGDSHTNQLLSAQNFAQIWGKLQFMMINLLIIMINSIFLSTLGAELASSVFIEPRTHFQQIFFQVQQLIGNIGMIIGKIGILLGYYRKLGTQSIVYVVLSCLFFYLLFIQSQSTLSYLSIQFLQYILRGYIFTLLVCLIIEKKEIDKTEKEISLIIMCFTYNFGFLIASLISQLYLSLIQLILLIGIQKLEIQGNQSIQTSLQNVRNLEK